MIRPVLLLLALLLPLPATAQSLPGFHGRWQGEGAMALGSEPEQRFSCRLQLRPVHTGQTFLVGRCATAQVQQSFAWMLTEDAAGALTAEDTNPPPDRSPPARMQGSAAPDRLSLSDGAEARLEMQRDGETLRFTIAGQDSRGPVRGEAVLQRRE